MLRVLGFALVMLGTVAGLNGPATASITAEEMIQGVIVDVIGDAVEAATDEVRRNTWGGYEGVESSVDGAIPGDASDETRRELAQLNQEHDRRIAELEDELRRKLEKAEREFAREAANEDKPEKIEAKREKLQEKTDTAYAKFEEKMAEENERFSEKRNAILARAR